ncbi:hypothetical protein D3C75_1004270 [compost metagenome]
MVEVDGRGVDSLQPGALAVTVLDDLGEVRVRKQVQLWLNHRIEKNEAARLLLIVKGLSAEDESWEVLAIQNVVGIQYPAMEI